MEHENEQTIERKKNYAETVFYMGLLCEKKK